MVKTRQWNGISIQKPIAIQSAFIGPTKFIRKTRTHFGYWIQRESTYFIETHSSLSTCSQEGKQLISCTKLQTAGCTWARSKDYTKQIRYKVAIGSTTDLYGVKRR